MIDADLCGWCFVSSDYPHVQHIQNFKLLFHANHINAIVLFLEKYNWSNLAYNMLILGYALNMTI